MFNFQTVSAFDKHYHHLGVLVEAMLASRDRQLEELLIRTWYLSRFPKTRMPVIKEVAFTRSMKNASAMQRVREYGICMHVLEELSGALALT